MRAGSRTARSRILAAVGVVTVATAAFVAPTLAGATTAAPSGPSVSQKVGHPILAALRLRNIGA